MYITKIELNEEISSWQITGKPSDHLIKIINKLIIGIIGRYGIEVMDKESCSQSCWILILRNYHKLNKDGNSFGYLTTMVLNSVRHAKRGQRMECNKLINYSNECKNLLPTKK